MLAAGAIVSSPVPAAIVEGVAARGYAVVPAAAPPALVAALRRCAVARDAAGELAPAGVCRGAARHVHAGIRGDRIAWLDPASHAAAETDILAYFESLRVECNRALLLGLFEFEGHFALYPPGASYARHRDRFRDDDARMLSCVLYLNDAWLPACGGALRLHLDSGRTLDVLPDEGTLVVFLSERFEHEVLPATRPRLALTGWFRRRGA